MPESCHADWEAVSSALAQQGWVVLDDAISADLCRVLRSELDTHAARGEFKQAAIGHGEERAVKTTVRSDQILWFDGSTPAQQAWLTCMDALRVHLNRKLFLGLQEFECHFARYAPGSFYRRHYDRFHDDDARVVTTVLYLTPDWSEQDGGQLVLYDPIDTERVLGTVVPEAGRFVVFLSADFPHEVLPTQRERASITGWFRQRPVR